MIMYARDFRAIGICATGMRQFCSNNGLDYIDFVQNGIDVDILKSFNDAMIDDAIDKALKAATGDIQ